VVYKLDRLARSTKRLIKIADELRDKNWNAKLRRMEWR
jgi:DNA invertase Pin-like site-specific DNA recombinase